MSDDERGQSGGVNITGRKGEAPPKVTISDKTRIYQEDSTGEQDHKLEAEIRANMKTTDDVPSEPKGERGKRVESDESKKLRMTYAQFEEKRNSLKLLARQMKEFLDVDGKKWKYGVMNIDWMEFASGNGSTDYVANYDLIESQTTSKSESETPKNKTTIIGDLSGRGRGVNIDGEDITIIGDVTGRDKK